MRAAVITQDGLKIIDKDSPEYRETVGERAYWEERHQDSRELEANRLRRIKNTYKGMVVSLILLVEKAYEAYLDEDTEESFKHLWELLKKSVDYWAEHYAFLWSGKWFCVEDFVEYFEDETRKEIEKYDYWTSPFYLQERVNKKLEGRGHDFVRMKAKTGQGEFEHSLGRFSDFANEVYPGKENTEKTVTERILLDQIMNEPSLTDLERKFLQVRYENLDASFDELSFIMGLGNKVKAWRLMDSIRKKLEKYREDALAYDADAFKWQYKQPRRKRRSLVVEVDDSLDDDIKPDEDTKTEKTQQELKEDDKAAPVKNDKKSNPKKKKKQKRLTKSQKRNLVVDDVPAFCR